MKRRVSIFPDRVFPDRHQRFCSPRFVLWATLCLSGRRTSAGSAPDDIAAPTEPNQQPGAMQRNNFEQAFQNIEANVFHQYGNARQARTNLELRLKMQVDDLNRICTLNEEQRHKLKLAGGNDIKRFFDEFEAVRKKYKEGKHDQEAWNNFWQEVNPLQTKLAGGLFGPKSFFMKSIRGMLSTEQIAKYDVADSERRQFRYHACIEAVLEDLELTVPFTARQQEDVVNLLLQESRPPLIFGHQNQQVVLHNLGKIPEERLKPMFDERQWEGLKRRLDQARGQGQWMVQQGIIAKEDVAPKRPRVRVRGQIARPSRNAAGAADAMQIENKPAE